MNGSEENQMDNNSFVVLSEQKKSVKKPLIIALIIAIVLALIGGGVYLYLTTQSQSVSDQQSEDENTENGQSEEQTYICSTNIVPQIISDINNRLDSGEMDTSDVPIYYTRIYEQALDQDSRARRVCILNLLPEVDNILSQRNDYQSELELLTSIDYDNLDDGGFTLVEYTQHFYYKEILELAAKLGNQEILYQYQPLYDNTKAAWDEIERKKAQAIQNESVIMGETE